LGYRAALVAQDGATPESVPWDSCEALFVGGTTKWKLGSPAVVALLDEARRRGKWVHLGRVNSYERTIIAALRKCDSIDGTFLAFGKEANLGDLVAWMDVVNRQQSFF
jgi:hypothetical protein